MNTLLCLLAAVLAVVVGVLLWITEDDRARARRWHRSGVSQRQIAQRLSVSRYRVKVWVAGC
jgi:DNA-binding transcriptional regulator LsrR (DeoR family)